MNGIDFCAVVFIVIVIFNQRHGSQVDEDVAFGDVAVLYLRSYRRICFKAYNYDEE